MTPLLGTKTPSAPVGDRSGGGRRAARSLLSCALWRGLGGYGAAWAAAVPRTGNRAFRVFTRHGFFSNHDLYGRSVLRGCARGGVTRNRPPDHCLRRQVTVFQFTIVHDCFHESQLPCPRFPTISHDFPAFPGPPTSLRRSSVHAPSAFLGQPPGTAAPARSLLSCALWRGMGRLWRGMGGRRRPHRQHGLPCSPAVRYFFWSEPGTPTMVFTKHGFFSHASTVGW